MILPRTLKEIGSEAFEHCNSLRAVCAENGCEIGLSEAYVPNSVQLVLLSSAFVGDVNI